MVAELSRKAVRIVDGMKRQTAVDKKLAAAIRAAERAEKRAAAQAGFGNRRLLTPLEASAFLDCAERTLECWRQRGGGPPYIRLVPAGARAVRAVRYRLADLEAFITEREVASTSDPGPRRQGDADAHAAG